MFVGLLKAVNLNINKPEHHNLYCTNNKSKDMLVYDGRWQTQDKTHVMNILLGAKKNDLYKILEFVEIYQPTEKLKNLIRYDTGDSQLSMETGRLMITSVFNHQEIIAPTYELTRDQITQAFIKTDGDQYKPGWSLESMMEDMNKRLKKPNPINQTPNDNPVSVKKSNPTEKHKLPKLSTNKMYKKSFVDDDLDFESDSDPNPPKISTNKICKKSFVDDESESDQTNKCKSSNSSKTKICKKSFVDDESDSDQTDKPKSPKSSKTKICKKSFVDDESDSDQDKKCVRKSRKHNK